MGLFAAATAAAVMAVSTVIAERNLQPQLLQQLLKQAAEQGHVLVSGKEADCRMEIQLSMLKGADL